MKEDHNCANLVPIGARPSALATQKEKGLAALEKLKSWSITRKSGTSSTASLLRRKPAASASSATTASINALKTAAKGDDKIPVEKRLYLHVEASADTTKAKYPTGKFFYSNEWTVGRVLDAAAKSLQVENVNNRVGGEAERLRVFHVEAGRLLDFSEKLGSAVQNGNTIVLLRGVGPPVPT